MDSLHGTYAPLRKNAGTGLQLLKELEGPRGGRAWEERQGVNLADLTKPL